MSLDLIYDRTDNDVSRLKEQKEALLKGEILSDGDYTEYMSFSHKGAYNYTDLNRVNVAMRQLSDMLNALGYYVRIDTKSDWSYTDIPTKTQMDNYIANIETLRNVVRYSPTTPPCPSDIIRLTIEEANNIEKILSDLYDLLVNIQTTIPYCAAIGTADVGLYFGG